MRHNQEVNQSIETDRQTAQISEFAGKAIKITDEHVKDSTVKDVYTR